MSVHATFLVLLLTLSSVASGSQSLNTLSLNFQRKTIQGDSVELVKGVAYYQAPQKVSIHVQDPIRQVMFIDGEVMLIYYPVEKKAFRIKAKGPIPMPFVQTILSVMKDDYGLTEMGYTLAKHETKDGTLYTHWDPPRKLKKKLGRFVLGTAKGVLVYAEARDPKDRIAAKSFYKKHTELAGKHFPLEVRSEIYNGSNRTDEYVVYSDVKLNITLPDNVANFELPDSVAVREVEW
jgi:outer membrane lipoprotein-sorting protein